MKKSTGLVWLSSLVALFALICSAAGLFWQDGGSPYPFTNLHGQTVQVYGQGLYRFDSYFKAPIFRGTDAVTLFVIIPLLVLFTVRYHRGSLKGGLLLTGILTYFLYNAASMALGSAYNNLFLIYILYFSTSLFAFIFALTSVDLKALSSLISPRLPIRAIAIFQFIAGLSVLVWLIDIFSAMALGKAAPDSLAHYTTEMTAVLDIGIITPTAYLAGILLLRRAPLGYLLAFILTVMNATIGLMVAGQTVSQAVAGIILSPMQAAAFVTPFVVMSLFAVWIVIIFLRNLSEPASTQPSALTWTPSARW